MSGYIFRRDNWLQVASALVIVLLMLIVVFLIRQNRELKSGLSALKTGQRPSTLWAGKRVGPVNLHTLANTLETLNYGDSRSDFLLFVFSTTCPFCEKTWPNWEKLAEAYAGSRVQVIGISMHGLELTKAYVDLKKPSFDVLLADTVFARVYGISGVPETILVRGDGVVAGIWTGILADEHLEAVANLLRGRTLSKYLNNK